MRCALALESRVGSQAWRGLKHQGVELCAALGLALAPRPAALAQGAAGEVVLQVSLQPAAVSPALPCPVLPALPCIALP